MRPHLCVCLPGLVLASCVELPQELMPDLTITAQQDARVCGDGPSLALSSDGNTLAFSANGNVFTRYLPDADTILHPTASGGLSNMSFSSDGHWLLGQASYDPQVIGVVDMTTTNETETLLGDICNENVFAWGPGADQFSVLCTDYVIRVYAAQNPNAGPVQQVGPPPGLSGCVPQNGINLDTHLFQALASCNGAGEDSLVAWTWSDGAAVITSQVTFPEFDAYSAVLPYPDLSGVQVFAINPTRAEVVLASDTLYLADPEDDFKPTGMLSDNLCSNIQYSFDGSLIAAIVLRGYTEPLQVWRLSHGSDPILTTPDFDVTAFALANNNAVAACGADGMFRLWRLSPAP